jgi:hypothetical protein
MVSEPELLNSNPNKRGSKNKVRTQYLALMSYWIDALANFCKSPH